MPTLPERACAFCGKKFVPGTKRAMYCSSECNKRAWIARRGAERAARRKSAVRVCERCGRPFEWSNLHGNRRFCSYECKRRAEVAVRRVSRTRADCVRVKAAATPPAALDALRGSKGAEYFRTLFSLPAGDQYAEMATWGEADHEAAAEYLGVHGADCGADGFGGDDLGDITIPATPPSAFDEEDHFGQQ